MKWLVLLALVGLASCRTVLVGGNNARDVTIQYTYEDQYGDNVDVEYQVDQLNLALLNGAAPSRTLKSEAPPSVPKAAPRPTLKSAPALTPTFRAAPTPAFSAPIMAPSPMYYQFMPMTSMQFMPMSTFGFPSMMQPMAVAAPQVSAVASQVRVATPQVSAVAPQFRAAVPKTPAVAAKAPAAVPQFRAAQPFVKPSAPVQPAAPAHPVPMPKANIYTRYTDDDDSDEMVHFSTSYAAKPLPAVRKTSVVSRLSGPVARSIMLSSIESNENSSEN